MYTHDGITEAINTLKLVINVVLINLCSLFCDSEHTDLLCVDTTADRADTEVTGAI
jgi:hypothetical protein